MKVARLAKDGTLSIKGELVEYPREIAGPRNYWVSPEPQDLTDVTPGHQREYIIDDNFSLIGYGDGQQSRVHFVENGFNVEYKEHTKASVRHLLLIKNLLPNTEYTLSFTPSHDGTINTRLYRLLFLPYYPEDDNGVRKHTKIISDSSGEYEGNIWYDNVSAYNHTNQNFYVRDIKLELNEEPSNYTPAPEDLGLLYADEIQSFQLSLNQERLLTNQLISEPDDDSYYLDFNGSDSEVTNINAHGIPWDEGTWEMWIKPHTDFTKQGTGYYQSLLGVEQYSPSFRLRSYFRGGDHFYFQTITDGGSRVRVKVEEFNANEWQHLAVVYSHIGGFIKVYLNGIEVGSSQYSQPTNSLNGVFSIGSQQNNVHFDGGMHDFAIWNEALTKGQITALIGGELDRSEANLVVYLPMNEGSGKIAKDISGNNNDGTLKKLKWSKKMMSKIDKLQIKEDKVFVNKLIQGVDL